VVENSRLDQELACKWQLDMPKHGSIIDTCIEKKNKHRSSDLVDASTLSNLLEDLTIGEDKAPFRRHKCLPNETTASKLLQRIPKKELEAHQQGKLGYIYLFTQRVFPGMVKIGYTNSDVQKRLSYWSKCGHGQPCLVQSISGVPQAKRVETLVHHELSSFWRRERYCRLHSSAHTEWFEIESARAANVVAQWVSWMNEAQPYDELGDLNMQWRSMVQTLIMNEVSVTSELLMDLYTFRTDDPYLSTII